MGKIRVAFSTAISSVDGDLVDVIVYLQGFRQHTVLEDGAFKVKTEGMISSRRILEVTYAISAPNGTNYKIVYACSGDDQRIADLEKPSPIERAVAGGSYAQEIVKFRF